MITKLCEVCGVEFRVQPYRAATARFCSQACGGTWHARTRLARVKKPWAIGNRWRAGKPPANAFAPGHAAWNKDLKGIRLSPGSEFRPGSVPANRLPLGSETIRTDRTKISRVFVKVADPNVWRPRAVLAWERANGPIVDDRVVHHRDRDTLNDDISNLELITRAAHIEEHREELRLAAARAGQMPLLGSA